MLWFRRRPRKGERYEVVKPFVAGVLTMWKAPFTGGDEKTLPVGLRFVVTYDPPASATAISADAEPYAEWEEKLVDVSDRSKDNYSSFYLVISFKAVRSNCKRVLS